ncbi:MAG: hypothetical protein WC712_08540 [Candidatus Brocadiia bacterium]
MDWVKRIDLGRILAATAVFLVLVLIALPANFRSRSDARYKRVLKYVLSFQSAAARFQNDSPALRFFADTEEIRKSGFALQDKLEGYYFIYVVDKNRFRFTFIALPDPESSDQKAFYGDETGTVYTTLLDSSTLKNELNPITLPSHINFDNEPPRRLPGDWVTL